MKFELKRTENSMVEITVEEEASKISKYRKKAISALRKNADIKGFRKGAEIPESVIVKNYGEERINEMTVEQAIDALYRKALQESKIIPVSQGGIKEIISQSPLKFVIVVEVYPEVEIKEEDYKKIEIKKTQVRVTQKEIDLAIEDIQRRLTSFEAVEDENYETKEGDRIYIDTDGYDKEGNLLPNTSMREHGVAIGSNSLVPGFEEGLKGVKLGEEKELDITFPEDYHNAEFASKETKFKVTIKKIETAIVPEITPEFVKTLRGKEMSVEEFKDAIKAEISDVKKSNARRDDEEKLMDELFKIAKVEIGDTMMNRSIQNVYEEIKQNIAQSGAKVSDYITSLGMSEEEYLEKNVRPVAERRLKGELILHKIQENEQIEATDKEIQKEIDQIMSKYESEDVKARLRDLYKEDSKYYFELKTRLNYTRLIDTFIK